MSILVKNGYDPTEADKVWQKLFNEEMFIKEQKITSNQEGIKESGLLNSTELVIDKYNKEVGLKGNLMSIGLDLLLTKKNKTITKKVNESTQTHPDLITRISDFNHLIEKFYSKNGLIEKTKNGEKEFNEIILKSTNELKSMYEEQEIIRKKDSVESKTLSEKFEKTYRIVEKQVIEKSNILLEFKNYKMFGCVNVNNLVTKSTCDKALFKINLNKFYEYYSSKVNLFITEFKKGTIDPNNKNELFAINYNLVKKYNDFAKFYVTLVMICDSKKLKLLNDIIQKKGVESLVKLEESEVVEVFETIKDN